MNPITNMKNLNKMNDRELEMGLSGTKNSWHNQYSDSAWIFVGGLPYDLSEGDVICVFSQYGEIVHINLVRDLQSGKSKGFSFICYEDQRSTILAVDNLNGAKVLGRLLRVDHVQTYKLPKNLEKLDEERKKLLLEGCAPKPIEDDIIPEDFETNKKKHKKKKKKRSSSSSQSENEEDTKTTRIRASHHSEKSDRQDSKEKIIDHGRRERSNHRERSRETAESYHKDKRSEKDDIRDKKRDRHTDDDYKHRSQERKKVCRDRSRDRDDRRGGREESRSRHRDRH